MAEHLFEISEKTEYWLEKNKRRFKIATEYENGVLLVMKERQPVLAEFAEGEVNNAGVEGPLVRFGVALAYDPIRRQFDQDGMSLEIEREEIDSYLQSLHESIKVPSDGNPQRFFETFLEHPGSLVDVDWMIDKISRTGPRYKKYLISIFGNASEASVEVTGTRYFAQPVFNGMLHTYLPIARKLDGIAMRDKLGL